MKVYHRTYHAKEILVEGFRDATGYYLTTNLYTGVWFSNRPLDINEGADGDTLLTIDIPESALTYYEWVEEGKPYREFLIPASLANQYGPPTIVECDEDGESSDDIGRMRSRSNRRGRG